MPKAIRDPKKYCRHCQRRLRRKRYNGILEDLGIFGRRKYCDRLCMAQSMKKVNVSRDAHLWRARRYRKTFCERCGSNLRLHAHHRDHDYTNDEPSNLETLCAKCHGEHHGPRRGELFTSRIRVNKEDFATLCELLRFAIEGKLDRTRAEELLHHLGHL